MAYDDWFTCGTCDKLNRFCDQWYDAKCDKCFYDDKIKVKQLENKIRQLENEIDLLKIILKKDKDIIEHFKKQA